MVTETFSLSEDTSEEFNAYPEELNAPVNDSVLYMSASLEAARRGLSPDYIKQEIDRYGSTYIEPSTRSRSLDWVNADFKQELDRGIEISDLPTIRQAEVERANKTEFVKETGSPEAYSLARDNTFSHLEARYISRHNTMVKIIGE